MGLPFLRVQEPQAWGLGLYFGNSDSVPIDMDLVQNFMKESIIHLNKAISCLENCRHTEAFEEVLYAQKKIIEEMLDDMDI